MMSVSWRSGLAKAAVAALENNFTVPYRPEGPFRALVKMRDGEMVARKIAHRWKLDCRQDEILINTGDMHELFMHLIRICYLTPLVEKMLPLSLAAYNLWGRFGLAWIVGRSEMLNSMEIPAYMKLPQNGTVS